MEPWGHFRLRCTTDDCDWAILVTAVDDPGRLATSAAFRVHLRIHADLKHHAVRHPTGYVTNLDIEADHAEIAL